MRIYDHVMRMFNMGFSITPPLVPGGAKGQTILVWKNGEKVGWKPFQEERATPQQLEKWYLSGNNGRYNRYGIITGAVSGIVVLDSDDTPAEQFINDNCPPSPVRSRSGSGRGLHHVYQYPGFHVQNVTKLNGFKLDVRGDGGLIVGPGSVHSSGGIYKELALWSVPALKSCPVFDPSWLGLQRVKKVAPVSSPQARPDVPYTTKQALAAEWLKGKKGAIGGDAEKPSEPYCLALAVALTWGFDLTADEALPVFLVWGEREDQRHTNGDYYPWTEAQLLHKLRDAETKEDREGRPKGFRIGSATTASIRTNEDRLRQLNRKADVIIEDITTNDIEDNESVSPVLTPPIDVSIQVEEVPKQAPYWTASDMWTYQSNRKELIPYFLVSGTHTLFSAREKRGKTHWLVNFISDWLGMGEVMQSLVEPVPMIYLDFENGIDLFQKFYFARLFPKPEHPMFQHVEKNWRYLSRDRDQLPGFLTVEWLEQITDGLEPGFIFNDTVRGSFRNHPDVAKVPGWENDQGTVGKLLRPVTDWCHKTGWNVVSVHHNNKNEGASGSTEFGAAVDTMWSFSAPKGDDEPERKIAAHGRGTRGNYHFSFSEEGRYTFVDNKELTDGEIEEFILKLHENCVLTQSQVKDKRQGIADGKIRAAHAKLVKEKKLVKLNKNEGYKLGKVDDDI